MPTSIITDAVAGPFRLTYSGPSGANPVEAHLGVVGERGVRQIRRYEGEEYTADLLGNSIVEGVYLGGQMFLEFTLEEANLANVMCMENPFRKGTLSLTTDGDNEVGVPGTFMTSYAGSLNLIPLYAATGNVHTTAGAQTTPVRSYGLVTLAGGFEKEKLFASKRRVIPMRLRCFPYSNGGSPAKYIWYSSSAIQSTYYVD
jgi:hypothetical protein